MEKGDFKDSCRTSSCYLFICSRDQLLEREVKYLEKVFPEKNSCPKYPKILDKAFEEHSRKNATNTTLDEENEHTTEKKHVSACLSR